MKKIADAKIKGNWFYAGSTGSELEGMVYPWKRGYPEDLDIAVDKKALGKFRKLFGKKGRKKGGDEVVFVVDGVIVELCLKPRKYELFKKIKSKNGYNTLSLKDQIRRYELAGSREKELRIKIFLETGKVKIKPLRFKSFSKRTRTIFPH